MIIRACEEKDLETIALLEKTSFPVTCWTLEQWKYEYFENPCSVLLVLEEGKVFAYIDFWILYEQAEICKIAIAEPLRRRGLGTILMKEALKIIQKEGVEQVNLEVRVDNEAAIRLYKKFGFEIVYVKKGYYEDGVDAYQMMKKGVQHAEDYSCY